MKKWLCLLSAVCAGAWFVMPRSSGSPPPDAVDEAPKELVFVPVKIDGPAHDPARHRDRKSVV